MKDRALFLDRDGVINVDAGYVHLPEQVIFLDGIFDLCRAARAKDYRIIIITNQAGIGRGLYTEAQFHDLMHWMGGRFKAEGAAWDAYYFCPHHPEHGIGVYRIVCECRKPKPGMLLRAQSEWAIDMANSIFIGDKPHDMEAGHAAGVGKLHLLDSSANVIPNLFRDLLKMLK